MSTHPPENEEYIDASGIRQTGLIADYRPSAGSGSNSSNREIVEDYIHKVLKICEVRISRADIIRVAAYKDRREFERWQRGDHKLGSKADRRFRMVLSSDPHEFLNQLKISKTCIHKSSR